MVCRAGVREAELLRSEFPRHTASDFATAQVLCRLETGYVYVCAEISPLLLVECLLRREPSL